MADNWQLKAVLSANAEGMLKTLKAVNQATKTTRKYLLDVGSAGAKLAGHIGMPLGLVSSALAGLSLVGIKNAVTGFTELAESLHASALRTGMTVEQLQRMKYVADQAGVPIEMLEGGISKLNKNIGQAAAGKGKDLAALFKKLGIEARDSNGHLRGGMDMLPELADAFQRNTNPVTRARMGFALFGKTWKDMIPLLAEGSEEIKRSSERWKLLKGMGIDAETIEGARQLGKQFKDVDVITKGFQNTIAQQLVPVIRPLVEDFIQWAAVNRKIVATRIADFIKDMIAGLRGFDWAGLIESVKSFGRGLGELVDFLGGAKGALITLAIVMNLQTIAAAWGLVASIAKVTWSLGAMTATAIPAAITSMGSLATAMGLTGIAAGSLLAKMGLIGAAAAAGYGLGTLINDYVINPGVEMMTGEKGQTMGGWVYDKTHPSPLTGGQKVNTSGSLVVHFEGAPPGMSVTQTSGGDVPIDTDVGYNYNALNMG